MHMVRDILSSIFDSGLLTIVIIVTRLSQYFDNCENVSNRGQ